MTEDGELRIIFIASALVAAAPPAPAAARAATPTALENQVWRAFEAKNVAEIRSLFAPGFVGIYADGKHDLARELESLKHATIRDYRMVDFDSRALDADDVLLTYGADVNAVVDSRAATERIWMASLWHRTGGRWLCVYHTEIKAK